jgi:hypothetical protein
VPHPTHIQDRPLAESQPMGTQWRMTALFPGGAAMGGRGSARAGEGGGPGHQAMGHPRPGPHQAGGERTGDLSEATEVSSWLATFHTDHHCCPCTLLVVAEVVGTSLVHLPSRCLGTSVTPHMGQARPLRTDVGCHQGASRQLPGPPRVPALPTPALPCLSPGVPQPWHSEEDRVSG